MAGWSVEGPVACRDSGIVHDGDGAVEDVKGKAFNPPVPVALVKLITSVGVAEESSTFAHFRAQGVVKVTPPTWTKPLEFGAGSSAEFTDKRRCPRDGLAEAKIREGRNVG